MATTSNNYAKDYTNPQLREKLKKKIHKGTKGGEAGKWSARKAQLLNAEYKKQGGEYKHSGHRTEAQKHLKGWSSEHNSATSKKAASKKAVSSKKASSTSTKTSTAAKKKAATASKPKTAQSHVPTAEMARMAKQGLKLREQFKRGGTQIGIQRAHQLAKRQALDSSIITRMVSYFARHTVDKNSENFSNQTDPSNGYIAWLLWGGDAGKKWAEKQKEKLSAQKSKK